LFKLLILDDFVPTIIENEPLAIIANRENSMILKNSSVVHEDYSQVCVRHASLMKCRILGKRIVLTVTMPVSAPFL
jgi:hypothetical protein